MSDALQVVCCADRMPDLPYLRMDAFLASARRYGYDPVILGWGKPWGGLASKPRLLKEAIEGGIVTAKNIIFADAHDVFFAASPDEILTQWKARFQARIVWNAERECFPNHELAEKFTDHGTPYRYLNSGLSIGETAAYHECLTEMGADKYLDDQHHGVNRNDQLDWQERFLFGQCPGQVVMSLDPHCVLFQAMFLVQEGEIEVSPSGEVYNRLTGTSPLAFHFNGPAKTAGLLEPILAAMGL